jgi:hypothetical protein
MNDPKVNEWISREDSELMTVFAEELRDHLARLRAESGFYAYAVLSLAGDKHKFQYLSAAFNRESDIAEEHRDEVYYRLSPNEWTNYGLDVFPRSAELLTVRNTHFAAMYQRADPTSYMLDDTEIAHITNLHRSLLTAMRLVRDEGHLGREVSFAVLWAPDSPDDIMFCSAKSLNTSSTFDDFMSEFGDDFLELECDCFD